MNDNKLDFLLDLFYSGYKNAYVSVIDLQLITNDWRERIEIILPNVGRLCLYQKFYETNNDEQIPGFKVFYTCANEYNKKITLIKNKDLKAKAIHLVYECKHYFETQKITPASNDMVIKTVLKNSKTIKKMQDALKKQQNRWFDRFK